MKRVFVIDISNKEDFAKAYEFIANAQSNRISQFDDWQLRNIKVCSNSFFEYQEDGNTNKDSIKFCEKHSHEYKLLNNVGEINIENDEFYFRVSINNDNDIVILHYYFLINNKIKYRNYMGIIVHQNEEQTFITERMISSFLICEKENFKKNKVAFKIIKAKTKYHVKLIPALTEKVFFLRKNNRKYYSPCEIDDKGINASHAFFPLLRIKKPNVYLTLSKTADEVFGNLSTSSRKNNLFYNDLLYKMASQNEQIDWNNKQEIKRLSDSSCELYLNNDSFLIEVLKSFANNCLTNICQGMSKEERKRTRDYIKSVAKETTVLAMCIFLSFLFYIKAQNGKLNLDSLLMDAEDYSDGLLQLIENVVKHADDGFFCFRIHTVNEKRKVSDSKGYLKKYEIDFNKNEYYLEALVSDYNDVDDIPKNFLDKLKQNYDETTPEYDVPTEYLENIQNDFVLADLFDYKHNKKTEEFWSAFYNKSQNLTSHYGLMIFERLVDFANGAFNVISCKDFYAQNEFVYKLKSSNALSSNNSSFEIHIPGTQYEILLPIDTAHPVKDTGLNYTLKMDDVNRSWNCYWISQNVINYNLNENDENILLRPYYKNMKVANICKEIIENFLYNKVEDSASAIMCFDAEDITSPIISEVIAKAFIGVLCDESIADIKKFAFKNASDQFMNTFIRVFSLLYIKSRQNKYMSGRQVYICSKLAQKEILFYGDSLNESLVASKNIALIGRGEPTREYRFLERQTQKAKEEKTLEEIKISPLQFDVIVDGVFKDKVKADLERNIQKSEFGCCLQDVHMRVGSKIHMHGNYYEASLLFSNSNYVSRFAFYIYENLVKEIEEEIIYKNPKKIVLLGYESYSESLMIELKSILKRNKIIKDHKVMVDYSIYYENNREQPFARWEKVKPDDNTKFIVIVPIGSTLTTHDKIIADLQRQKDEYNKKIAIENVVAHFTVVLIRNLKEDEMVNGCRGIENIFGRKLKKIMKPTM